jgi:chemotaxis protein methyltransferase CheR
MARRTDTAQLREFELSDTDFERVQQLVHAHIGISLANSKRELVYSRLSRRLRALDIADFTSYLKRIEGGDALE